METRVLLLGVGNVILRDEGLGVRTLERLLAEYELPESLVALDGGTLGLSLLPYLEECDLALIIDAVRTGEAPGTIIRLEDEAIAKALALKMSMHQVGLQELLAICSIRETLPSKVVLWGMEPELMAPGLELTETVEQQLGVLVAKVAEELRGWGVPLTEKAGEPAASDAFVGRTRVVAL